MTALLTAIGAAAAFLAVTTSDTATAAASATLVDAQIVEVYVFLLAAFTGFQIITKVPPLTNRAGPDSGLLADRVTIFVPPVMYTVPAATLSDPQMFELPFPVGFSTSVPGPSLEETRLVHG